MLPVLSCRDPLSFRGIADEASLQQDRRNLDVPQDVKARVAHAAIEDRDSRKDRGVNGSSQRDILPSSALPACLLIVGVRQVIFLEAFEATPSGASA